MIVTLTVKKWETDDKDEIERDKLKPLMEEIS